MGGKRFTEVDSIIYGDIYRIRQYSNRQIDYIIDIGANVGTFSLMAGILFPESKILAYEPCRMTHGYLKQNLYGFRNIFIYNEALGDGTNLYFKAVGKNASTGHMFIKENTGQYLVKSKTLRQIFESNQIDFNKNIMLKMDCEGGERFLLSGEYYYIIKKCLHFAVEVHFLNRGKLQFKDMPEWETYSNWINTFKDTHKITYGHSFKHIGIGLYILNRK